MDDAERSEPEAGTVDLAAIPSLLVLNTNTLTLGEMAQIEMQSGEPFQTILAAALRGGVTRRLLALWVHESRTLDAPRSWQQLAALRPSVKSSSQPPSAPASASETSKD